MKKRSVQMKMSKIIVIILRHLCGDSLPGLTHFKIASILNKFIVIIVLLYIL